MLRKVSNVASAFVTLLALSAATSPQASSSVSVVHQPVVGRCKSWHPHPDPGGQCAPRTCDSKRTSCNEEPRPDGAACDDRDRCNGDDTCQGGRCVGSATPIFVQGVSGDPRAAGPFLSTQDGNGNLYLAATVSGALNVGDRVLEADAGDILLIKASSRGGMLYAKLLTDQEGGERSAQILESIVWNEETGRVQVLYSTTRRTLVGAAGQLAEAPAGSVVHVALNGRAPVDSEFCGDDREPCDGQMMQALVVPPPQAQPPKTGLWSWLCRYRAAWCAVPAAQLTVAAGDACPPATEGATASIPDRCRLPELQTGAGVWKPTEFLNRDFLAGIGLALAPQVDVTGRFPTNPLGGASQDVLIATWNIQLDAVGVQTANASNIRAAVRLGAPTAAESVGRDNVTINAPIIGGKPEIHVDVTRAPAEFRITGTNGQAFDIKVGRGCSRFKLIFAYDPPTGDLAFARTEPAYCNAATIPVIGLAASRAPSLTADAQASASLGPAQVAAASQTVSQFLPNFPYFPDTPTNPNAPLGTANDVAVAGVATEPVSLGDPARPGSILLADPDSGTQFGYVGLLQAKTSAPVWARAFGGSGEQRVIEARRDAEGNVFVFGDFEGSLRLGGDSLSSVGGKDLFLAKFGLNGELVFQTSFGGPGDDTAGTLSVAPNGTMAISGTTTGDLSFGPEPEQTVGSGTYVARFSPAADLPACAVDYPCLEGTCEPRRGCVVVPAPLGTECSIDAEYGVTSGAGRCYAGTCFPTGR
jgi:hypothetical protein